MSKEDKNQETKVLTREELRAKRIEAIEQRKKIGNLAIQNHPGAEEMGQVAEAARAKQELEKSIAKSKERVEAKEAARKTEEAVKAKQEKEEFQAWAELDNDLKAGKKAAEAKAKQEEEKLDLQAWAELDNDLKAGKKTAEAKRAKEEMLNELKTNAEAKANQKEGRAELYGTLPEAELVPEALAIPLTQVEPDKKRKLRQSVKSIMAKMGKSIAKAPNKVFKATKRALNRQGQGRGQ